MNRLFGGMHKCGVPVCQACIPSSTILCDAHYGLVPSWMQRKLSEARAYGRAWKCHPTQDFLDLRTQAIRFATEEATRKYGRPDGEQLDLIPNT